MASGDAVQFTVDQGREPFQGEAIAAIPSD